MLSATRCNRYWKGRKASGKRKKGKSKEQGARSKEQRAKSKEQGGARARATRKSKAEKQKGREKMCWGICEMGKSKREKRKEQKCMRSTGRTARDIDREGGLRTESSRWSLTARFSLPQHARSTPLPPGPLACSSTRRESNTTRDGHVESGQRGGEMQFAFGRTDS